MKRVTVQAPTNIAVVKYWGKQNKEFMLPLNSSLSATLNLDHFSTTTTITADPGFPKDEIYLNGVKEDIDNRRVQRVLAEVRALAGYVEDKPDAIETKQDVDEEENIYEPLAARKIDVSEGSEPEGGTAKTKIIFEDSEGKLEIPAPPQWRVKIDTSNNFPTAAGLASSASGFACLTYGLATLFGTTRHPDQLSRIGRLGSGSAARSFHGGWVAWRTGDAAGSIGQQIAPRGHWPELRVLVCIVNPGPKGTASSVAMARSARSSQLLTYRVEHLVPKTMANMEKAILNKDFQEFAKLTMRESNQLHAICLDTNPPVFYLNDDSKAIMQLVHSLNDFHQRNIAAYTFDAGANAVIFTMETNVDLVIAAIKYYFRSKAPADRNKEFVTCLSHYHTELSEEFIKSSKVQVRQGAVQCIINTTIGGGPRVTQLK